MTKKLAKLGGWMGLLILAASISMGLSSCPSPSGLKGDKKVVNIDANLPLTGNLAVYGTSVRNGATLALEDLEKSDPNSPKLKFDWEDNGGNPQTAVSILQKQLLDTPNIYVSGVKPQTMAIKTQIDAQGIPHFVWIFDAFINKNTKNNFRTWVNYKIEAPLYLKYIQAKQAKRVAIIYVNLPHTDEQFNKLVIPRLKEQGITVYAEAYDVDLKDYKDIAVKVQKFKPDVIIINGFQNTIVGIIRALRPLGLIKDGNTIGTFDVLDAAQILGADELEGIRVIAPLFVTRPDKEQIVNWNKKFQERFGRTPLYTDAFAYDMVLIINDAAKRLKLPATSNQWIDSLRATKIEGITGPLSFDQDGDLITPLEIGVFRNGKLIPDDKVKQSSGVLFRKDKLKS